MTTTENLIYDMFDLDFIWPEFERVEKNRLIRPKGWTASWDECHVCGRPLNPERISFLVHMSTGNTLYPKSITDAEAEAYPEGDQGWFPVGPECAKKIPAAYKAKTHE